jgi:hypothetical protein
LQISEVHQYVICQKDRRAVAFQACTALTQVVFGEDLERIEGGAFGAFYNCSSLRRIAIPLKDNLIIQDRAFNRCDNLSRVDALVEGVHETISSSHMKSWRDEKEEIDASVKLDTQSAAKGAVINQWIESVLRRMEHYKTDHQLLVKQAMTLLELALWKAKLLDVEGRKCEAEEKMSQKAKIDVNSARKEHRVTCGANIVIKNVLPFLALK